MALRSGRLAWGTGTCTGIQLRKRQALGDALCTYHLVPADAISDVIANVVRGEIDYALFRLISGRLLRTSPTASRRAWRQQRPPLAAAARRANDR